MVYAQEQSHSYSRKNNIQEDNWTSIPLWFPQDNCLERLTITGGTSCCSHLSTADKSFLSKKLHCLEPKENCYPPSGFGYKVCFSYITCLKKMVRYCNLITLQTRTCSQLTSKQFNNSIKQNGSSEQDAGISF